jgi:hypothetical protein
MEEETGPVKLNTVLEGTHSQDSHPEKSVFKCHTFCIAKKKKKNWFIKIPSTVIIATQEAKIRRITVPSQPSK